MGRPASAIPAWAALGLAVSVLLSLLLRVGVPWEEVTGHEAIVFHTADSYYHMRLVDSMVENFPAPLAWDRYALHPEGQPPAVAPLFDQVVAGAALLLGGGQPRPELVDATGAVLPALFGVLLVFPAFALARSLSGDTATGVAAAFLIALAPGRLYEFSRLGAADHHALETLLAALVVTCLVAALVRSDAEPGAESARWSRRPVVLSCAAGLALGAYLLTWIAGSFLVAVVVAGLAAAQAACLARRQPGSPVFRIGGVTLGIALVTVASLLPAVPFRRLHLMSLLGGMGALAALAALSRAVRGRRGAAALFVAGAAAGAAAIAALAAWVAPGPAAEIVHALRFFRPGAAARTVGEVRSILFQEGSLSLLPAWWELAGLLVLAPAGMILSLARWGRAAAGPAPVFLAIYVLLAAAAAAMQQRFVPYLTLGLVPLAAVAVRRAWARRSGRLPASRRAALALLSVLLIVPGAVHALMAGSQTDAPDPGWSQALAWMREATPEPFGDPRAYTAPFSPPSGEVAAAAGYGVVNWWDDGYWLARLARRPPLSNPTQAGAGEVARFFLAEDEEAAVERVAARGARYVILDGRILLWSRAGTLPLYGRFPALAAWAGKPLGHYVERAYRIRPGTPPEPVAIYYPEYFRTLAARLYLDEGRGAPVQGTAWAVRVVERREGSGSRLRELAGERPFADEAAARAWIETRSEPGWRLASLDPSRACVDLEPLARLRLARREASSLALPVQPPNEVKIFELLLPVP